MEDIRTLADNLANLTVLECHKLAKIMEEQYGIKPAVSTVTTIAPKKEEEVVIEQTQFDVILKTVGQNKLNLIKGIKEMMSIGLIEAKSLVDKALEEPQTIKEKVSKDEAMVLQKTLTDLGAEVDVK